MKIAFSVWRNRIAPVFDVSAAIRLVRIENKVLVSETAISVCGLNPQQKIDVIAAQAETLVCGAISEECTEYANNRIVLVPFVSAEYETAVAAFLNNSGGMLQNSMPGCKNRRRKRHRNRRNL